jgi:cytochrome c-type biogenesis protein CcmH
VNITFWLIVCVLLAIAFFIIIPPLWKKREIKDTDSEQRNVKIAQDRARDLKQQLQAGALTQAQFDEQYEEMELTLGDDLDDDKKNEKKSSQGRWIVSVIMFGVPLFSVLTYFWLGEPDALERARLQQTQLTQQAENPSQADINAMVNGLAQRLQQQPDDGQGWFMLGRSYKYLQKYPLAVDAFAKAYVLLGDQTEVMLHYADALAMANGGKLSGKAEELIFKALAQSPDDVMGLWLGGLAKVEMGENAQAIQYWRKLETLLPPGSDSYQELQRLMSSIQTQSPGPATIEAGKKIAKANTPVSIDVQVSMSDGIKARVNPQDTVFIYVKALTGPPMPLAIVRKQVTDLPLSVTLDDTMAMMPKMKLSNFEQVKIMARITKSGAAMQQKGDFIGTYELQKLAEKTSVVVVINEEIK